MAEDKEPFESLTEIAQQTVEQITERTKGAMEVYFDWCQKAVAESPLSNTDLNKELLSYARENTAAVFEAAEKLKQAKDWKDAVKIQTDFMTTQLRSFSKQAKNIGEICAKTTEEVTKTRLGMSA
jgi:hypothetical protein